MTREEAIDFLREEKFKNVNSQYRRDWNDASDMAIEALSAEAVQGEWLEVKMDYGECSECGFFGLITDYCPNCGARMNGDAE